MTQKQTPGPIGTSCLTCKRRRKKCDRSRPACERCTTGGFECLGYPHNDKNTSGLSIVDSREEPIQREDATGESHAQPYQPPPLHFSGDAHPSTDNTWTTLSLSTQLSPNEQILTHDTHSSKSPSISFAPHVDSHAMRISDDGKDNSTKHKSLFFLDSHQLLPASQPRSSHHTYSAAYPFTPTPGRSDIYPEEPSQVAKLSHYPSTSSRPQGRQHTLSIPRSVPLEPTNIANIIGYVLTQYERLVTLSHFRPLPQQRFKMRQLVSWHLQLPNSTRWTMYMGAQIFESLLDGVLPEKTATYDYWIQRFERELHVTPNRELTNDEIQNRLCCELEIGFLKLRLKYDLHILQLLRRCAPIFLQIVFSDPALWPEGHNLTAVSVAHVLASTRYELGQFILLDILYATAYALPPMLEYDTSCPPLRSEFHLIEWVYGCPAEFHILLVEINARCALGHVALDWQDIERRIMSWQSCLGSSADEVCQRIARTAVQEIWRQTLLAYLYMAVCGVASDDPRVQSTVQQIFQLLSAVQRQDPPLANVHFLIQYLIAGACTPSEKRRAFVRSQMMNKYGNALWLLSGVNFVPLLDHLWHGAAANGRPIRWSDYIASRQAALPIPF